MLLEPKKTTVAYRCPQCGSGIMSAVGMFSLSADRIVLRCSNSDCPSYKTRKAREKDETKNKKPTAAGDPRSNDELDIVYYKDSADAGKVRLTVPCIFCGKPHTYTLNSSVFFGKDVFMLSCPYSGINICFMGDANHVKAELARSELELLDMLEENGIEDFKDFAGDENALPDPQIYEIVMFVIHDLDAEGKIYCKCRRESDAGSGSESDCESDCDREYDAEVTDEGVLVRCQKCGAKKLIPTNSLISAHDFLNCDSLTLE